MKRKQERTWTLDPPTKSVSTNLGFGILKEQDDIQSKDI